MAPFWFVKRLSSKDILVFAEFLKQRHTLSITIIAMYAPADLLERA